MNRDHDYGGVVANQLATLEHLGLFDRKLPRSRRRSCAKLADYRDANAEPRRPGPVVPARQLQPLPPQVGRRQRRVPAALHPAAERDSASSTRSRARATFDLKDPRLLVPGDPERSLIYHRMNRLGLGRMPHMASNVVDEEGAALIREWIEKMPR